MPHMNALKVFLLLHYTIFLQVQYQSTEYYAPVYLISRNKHQVYQNHENVGDEFSHIPSVTT